jgi:hypothetical protein
MSDPIKVNSGNININLEDENDGIPKIVKRKKAIDNLVTTGTST